jgi:threonine dehydratase
VLAGGNIDATTLISVTRFALTSSGRYLILRILIPDRPGQLAAILAAIATQHANVLAVTHYREGRSIGVLETEAELTLETRGEEHSLKVIDELVAAGFTVDRLR